ncbi:MAG: efflux RND transporter periplasmic adaptor subunit [Niabella sp.]
MKLKKLILWLLVLILIAVAVWFFRFRKKEAIVELITEKPHAGYISTSVMATGTVQPVDTVAVGTQVSGTITKVYVDFNSTVKKGQLLAQLDQSLLNATVQQYAATLQQAKSNLNYEQGNYKRQLELYKAGAISKADLEIAENDYKVARDQVTSNAAQVTSAQKNLSYSNIYSPINGTVLSRSVSEGQTVASSFSTPTLFSIAKDLTKMQVQASVDEADIGNVKIGQRATFTVDAFPADTFAGIVKDIRLQPTTSSNVVTYTTIIDAPNDDLKLKPGMTANINIYTEEINNALLISAKAVNYTPGEAIAKKFKIGQARSGKLPSAASDKAANKNDTTAKTAVHEEETAGKEATVWLRRGDSLIQKQIIVGLDDDVNLQVLGGLADNDIIVTGEQTITESEQTATSSGEERSPFMPQRRNNKSSGSGSKSGGGGPPGP